MADNDNESYEEGSFFDRIKESPRTVSALIIILIVAAAIYAFSGNDQPQLGQTDDGAVTTEDESTDEADEEEAEEEEATATASPAAPGRATPTTSPVGTPTAVTRDQMNEEAKTLPEARTTENAYVEVAEAGNGATHLARRAATRWLSSNDAGYTVTNEHRIYIEDYLQKQMGSPRLSIGEEQTISFDMVREAVDAAKNLNDAQLRNLSQYTHALS